MTQTQLSFLGESITFEEETENNEKVTVDIKIVTQLLEYYTKLYPDQPLRNIKRFILKQLSATGNMQVAEMIDQVIYEHQKNNSVLYNHIYEALKEKTKLREGIIPNELTPKILEKLIWHIRYLTQQATLSDDQILQLISQITDAEIETVKSVFKTLQES